MKNTIKHKENKKKALPKHSFQSLTTDQEELELRQQKSKTEKMHIQVLQRPPYPFTTYHVSSESGLTYSVEIRSFSDRINSCSCPDFQVNTLGTCKHVERVLKWLKYSKTKQMRNHVRQGSPFIEIYLDQTESPKVSVAWPNHCIDPDLKQLIHPLFSANGTLLSPPTIGINSIEYLFDNHHKKFRDNIRISSHLTDWITSTKQKEFLLKSKQDFLEDVKLGKRTTQIVSVPLYPYQVEGMLHLAFNGRALLADEMGLGKTIQAIAASELLHRLHEIKKVLVISPASLKGEWEEQIAQFTGLPTIIIRGSRGERLKTYQREAFFYLVNYEQVRSDFKEIQNIINPDIIILDEAQRIKNWQTLTAKAVKQLKSPYAFVLTGTPIENRIDEIYSIMQMVDPTVLGPLFKFHRKYYTYNEKGKQSGYQNLSFLHKQLQPVLLRRLKKDVEDQLPERTVNNFFVKMQEEQKKRYIEYEDRVAKLMHIMQKRPLTDEESKRLQQNLACMRMVADTPYILDENCQICPKLDELKEILAEIMEGNQNKIIIFSEWERMLFLVRDYVQNELKIDFTWHTGSVPQLKRLEDIKRFKNDPTCRFFLTTDSGSTGLNLQVANIVINLDLPWNPAKLEQRIARAWRKNQTKAVQVINLVCEDSIEHRMLTTLAQKKNLADGVLDGIGDFDRMDLPSARIDIVKQLNLFDDETIEQLSESLNKDSPNSRQVPDSPTEQLNHIKNQAVAHFSDRIHALEVYQNPQSNQHTVLAVVDRVDSTIEPKMEEIVQDQHNAFALELLDKETYLTLQRLQEAGLITIHSEENSPLYRSSAANRSYQTEIKQILTEAKKLLSEAERKMKMADLLNQGGFSIEALPSTKEALALGLKCYTILKKSSDQEGELLLNNLEKISKRPDEKMAQLLIKRASEQIQRYAEIITLFSLRIEK